MPISPDFQDAPPPGHSSMLDMPRGGAGVAAGQYAQGTGARGGGAGNTVSVGAVNVAQAATHARADDTLTRIQRTNRATFPDVGLA